MKLSYFLLTFFVGQVPVSELLQKFRLLALLFLVEGLPFFMDFFNVSFFSFLALLFPGVFFFGNRFRGLKQRFGLFLKLGRQDFKRVLFRVRGKNRPA